MTIGIYGRYLSPDRVPIVERLCRAIEEEGGTIRVHEHYVEELRQKVSAAASYGTFDGKDASIEGIDKLISIGGDGTLLDTIAFVRDSGVPILGLNTGRLGFLAQTSEEDLEAAVKALLTDDHELDPRSLVRLEKPEGLFGEDDLALNEFTLLKKNSSSMVTVHVHLDGEYLNTYWADGLIVATPTGSTAYSMSCGGPILAPDASDLIITPVAAHNLNIRPLVVPDKSRIDLKVEGPGDSFLATLDSRSEPVPSHTELRIKKAPFSVELVKLRGQRFSETLRNKLLWGMDKRN